MSDQNKKNDSSNMMFMPLGLCFGLSIGLAVGSAMGNVPVGMCMGLGIGMCFGSAIDAAKRSKAGEEKKDEEDQ